MWDSKLNSSSKNTLQFTYHVIKAHRSHKHVYVLPLFRIRRLDCSAHAPSHMVSLSLLAVSSTMVRQLRRVLLLGIPTLAIVGLLGLATWLWGRRRRRKPDPIPGRPRVDDNEAISDGERSPARKLRPNAEEFYPSTLSLNHLTSADSSVEKLGAAKKDSLVLSSAAKVQPTQLQPHPQLLKGAWIPSEQLRPVKGRGRQVHPLLRGVDHPTQLPDPPAATTDQADTLLSQQRSTDSLPGGVPLSSSQTTTSSGYSEVPLKSDDSGILVQGRKYPLASSDVQSETFSEAESFGSAEDISSRQLTVHEESNIMHSLLLTNAEKTAAVGVIGKAAVVPRKGGISASVSAPSLPAAKLHNSPPPQASLSMSSKDNIDSPLLRLDSFKNRVKVTIQLPRDSVGRFIGKQGRNIKTLMSESNTHVYVNQKNLPKEAVSVPCHIQGSATEVELALKQISIKFPEIDIPNSIDDISTVSATPLGSLSPLFANLEEGTNWDVQLKQISVPDTSPFYAMVSYIESLNRLWVFQYDSSRKLDELHQNMSFFYSYASSMGLPRVKEGDGGMVGRFCAAKVSDIHWLRAHVTKIGDDSHSYELQLVDYGSTVVLPPTAIRPLK